MPDPLETTVLAALREALSGDTRLSRRLALLEPTKKLAYMLGRSEASLIETPFSRIGMPPGLSSHCSREISGAQVTTTGDSQHATAALP
jgi:hypothetical protein